MKDLNTPEEMIDNSTHSHPHNSHYKTDNYVGMKFALPVLGGLLLLVGLTAGALFYQTSGPQTSQTAAAGEDCTQNIHCDYGSGFVCRNGICQPPPGEVNCGGDACEADNCHCTGGQACTGKECVDDTWIRNVCTSQGRSWCQNSNPGTGMTCCVQGYVCGSGTDGGCIYSGGGGGTITPTKTRTPTGATRTPTRTPTKTRTPTGSTTCQRCQHQVDVFWGPVLMSLAGPADYVTNPNRLLNANENYSLAGCRLVQTQVIPTPYYTPLSATCSNPKGKGYLRATLDLSNAGPLRGGYFKSTITNSAPSSTNCTYNVGMASYKANGAGLPIAQRRDTQNINDYQTARLAPGQRTTLYVKSPMLNDSAACHNLP